MRGNARERESETKGMRESVIVRDPREGEGVGENDLREGEREEGGERGNFLGKVGGIHRERG